jgi:hypothetical protein
LATVLHAWRLSPSRGWCPIDGQLGAHRDVIAGGSTITAGFSIEVVRSTPAFGGPKDGWDIREVPADRSASWRSRAAGDGKDVEARRISRVRERTQESRDAPAVSERPGARAGGAKSERDARPAIFSKSPDVDPDSFARWRSRPSTRHEPTRLRRAAGPVLASQPTDDDARRASPFAVLLLLRDAGRIAGNGGRPDEAARP